MSENICKISNILKADINIMWRSQIRDNKGKRSTLLYYLDYWLSKFDFRINDTAQLKVTLKGKKKQNIKLE